MITSDVKLPLNSEYAKTPWPRITREGYSRHTTADSASHPALTIVIVHLETSDVLAVIWNFDFHPQFVPALSTMAKLASDLHAGFFNWLDDTAVKKYLSSGQIPFERRSVSTSLISRYATCVDKNSIWLQDG